jgi:hypothetical protein
MRRDRERRLCKNKDRIRAREEKKSGKNSVSLGFIEKIQILGVTAFFFPPTDAFHLSS